MGCIVWDSREGHDGKRAHTLGAVDEHAFDVRRRGGTGVKHRVVGLSKLGPPHELAEREIERRNAWIQKFDLEVSVRDGLQVGKGLPDGRGQAESLTG